MTTNAQWAKLMEEHGIAYLRGDLATSSPQSYTIDEKRRICEQMEASTSEVDAALRADFWSMPAAARSRMLDLLGACAFRAARDAFRTNQSIETYNH